MKRAIISGFLALVGSIWSLAILFSASANLTTGWTTPPGRLLTTVAELGLTGWLVISVLVTLLGTVSLIVEYFRKS